jgi:hypothetical protein
MWQGTEHHHPGHKPQFWRGIAMADLDKGIMLIPFSIGGWKILEEMGQVLVDVIHKAR